MPINRILSTLTGIQRFASGVGDLEDLSVRVREDPDGGWFAVVHKGYYYIGTEQGYVFANRGRLTFTETSTGSISLRTINVSGLIDDPTEEGPIILTKSGNVRPLQRVSSPLRAFRPITTTAGSGDLKYFDIDLSGILVSVVSHPVTGILFAVPATGDIITNQNYVYDRAIGRVYLRGNLPTLFATYIVGEEQDMLKQEEVVIVDTDNKVRTQFKTVSMYDGQIPLIRKPTLEGTVFASGTAVTGNVITFASTGLISSGDTVAVEYYVKDSYSVVPSGAFLIIRSLVSTSGEYNLDYEAGDIYYDTSLLSSGSTDYIQLNPLLEQRESGFLYLKDETEPPLTPGRIRLSLSNHNVSWGGTFGEVLITATVFDPEGEHLTGQRVVLSTSGASGSLAVAFPTTQISNGKGQVVYVWNPAATGQVTATAYVSGFTSVSGTVSFFIRNINYFLQTSEQQLGKLLLHMEDQPIRDNLHRLSAYYCYPDGAPFQPDGSSQIWTTSVNFSANKSKFYTLDGKPLSQTTSINTNTDSIATILVDPIPGDIIRAYAETHVTGRIRTATPIRVPEGLKES